MKFMDLVSQSVIKKKAIQVIKDASSEFGIKASTEQKDNYNNIWTRDSAVTGLAILTNQIKEAYPALKTSLVLLQKVAAKNGQIPSNITVNDIGNITKVSFGGSVGRTDAGFWWIICSILYLQQQPDPEFKKTVLSQCKAIFKLATTWEFNGKGLMYLPMSSNWADEYITHGYVLYDQILRYWALELSGNFFLKEKWKKKAGSTKIAIKQHYLFEAELDGSLYTEAQRKSLTELNLKKSFVASFSPGDRVEKYDAWSIALLLLLNIPSLSTQKKLTSSLLSIFEQTGNKGVPAFWPVISKTDPEYTTLKFNHHYRFKNLPGHFHNGGIWPVVNGFLITGLCIAEEYEVAQALMTALHQQLKSSLSDAPFSEYYDLQNSTASGVINLCFSASGYLLATSAMENHQQFKTALQLFPVDEIAVTEQFKQAAQDIYDCLKPDFNKITAISISGESGSGKTTLSMAFKEILEAKGFHIQVLHQDDYFKLPPITNHEARLKDFTQIGPQEVRLNLLDEHIKKIKTQQNANLTIPYMDWIKDTEESREIKIEGVNIVLIDGTYSLLLQNTDYRVFVNTTYKQTKRNRIKRNREVVTEFIEKVLEKESEIIQQHKELAHIIINDKLQVQDKWK